MGWPYHSFDCDLLVVGSGQWKVDSGQRTVDSDNHLVCRPGEDLQHGRLDGGVGGVVVQARVKTEGGEVGDCWQRAAYLL